MKIVITLFSILNIFLAVAGFLPCLMVGAMSMDSPQAQESIVAHIICYSIITFPLVCLVCGTVSYFIHKFSSSFALLLSLLPITELVSFIGFLYLISKE